MIDYLWQRRCSRSSGRLGSMLSFDCQVCHPAEIALIVDAILFEKIVGDRRRHASYQGVVE